MNTQTMNHISRHAERARQRVTPGWRAATLPDRRQLFLLGLAIGLFPGSALAVTWATSLLPIGLAGAITWGLGLLVAAIAVDSTERGRLLGLLTVGLLTMILAIAGFSVAVEFIVLAVWILAGAGAARLLSGWRSPGADWR